MRTFYTLLYTNTNTDRIENKKKLWNKNWEKYLFYSKTTPKLCMFGQLNVVNTYDAEKKNIIKKTKTSNNWTLKIQKAKLGEKNWLIIENS